MYCGNCLRDNALVAALRRAGHQVLMVPLYLPLTLDETDQSAETPIFFSGINVYLEQKSDWFQRAPGWLHRLLTGRRLLKWAATRTASTRPEEVGAITVSMLQGQHGRQAREGRELAAWLRTQMKPDVVCVSNALLTGMVPVLRRELQAPVLCWLQGETPFVEGIPEPYRSTTWRLLTENARAVDQFIAPSRYGAEEMGQRLNLTPGKVRVIYNGINLEGFGLGAEPPPARTIGYFARLCREKGLDTLVGAFIELRRRNQVGAVRLKIGGGCGPGDEAEVAEQRRRLGAAGLERDVEFHPNLDRAEKIQFLQSLSVFRARAHGEVFGCTWRKLSGGGRAAWSNRARALYRAHRNDRRGRLMRTGQRTGAGDRPRAGLD